MGHDLAPNTKFEKEGTNSRVVKKVKDQELSIKCI